MNLNYDPNCPTCKFVKEDNIYTIYSGDLNAVVLNPRWSPHPGRCAIVPRRHLGENGKYPIGNWTDEELKEMGYLEKKTVDAQKKFARHIDEDLKKREGLPLIDRLIRPSIHPNLDLIPQYYTSEKPIKIDGYEFPAYRETVVSPGTSGITDSETIVGSFSGSEKNMPRDLVEEIVSTIKDFW